MAATTALVLTGITTAISVMGTLAQGQAQSAQQSFQADMAKKQGELAELSSRQEAADIQAEAQRTKAKQITQAAAAGLDISNSGSLWDIMNYSAKEAETERQNVLRAGRLNKASYGIEAQSYATAAKNTKSASYWKAGTTLLNGAATGVSIADKAGWFDKKA